MAWKKGEEFKVREEAVAQREKKEKAGLKIREEAISQREKEFSVQKKQEKREESLKSREEELSKLERPIRTKIIAREKRGFQVIKKKAPKYFGKLAKGLFTATKWGVQEWRRASEKARERRAMEGPRERVPMFPRKEPRYKPSRMEPSRIEPSPRYERRAPTFKRGPPKKGIFDYLPSMAEIEKIRSRKKVERRTGKSFRTRGGLTVQTRAGKLPKIKGLWDLF